MVSYIGKGQRVRYGGIPTGNYILTQQGKGVERVPAVGNMTF